jgi:hypothetical protein
MATPSFAASTTKKHMAATSPRRSSYLSAFVMLIVLCSLAVSGRAMIAVRDDIPGLPSIPVDGHETVRASVTNPTPHRFTIDVRKFANIGVNENAPTFALYLTRSIPRKCGDFRELEIDVWAPSKYKRILNLEPHEGVIRAINGYGCVVMRNRDHTPQ